MEKGGKKIGKENSPKKRIQERDGQQR